VWEADDAAVDAAVDLLEARDRTRGEEAD